jgi:hypothetical protein
MRDSIVAIKVWEGETPQDPEANLWVGAMTILGGRLGVLSLRALKFV